MKRTGAALPLLVLALTSLSLSSAGCASASVYSKREPGELPRLSRLFVAGSSQGLDDSAPLGELSSAMVKQLSARGVASSAYVFEPAELSSPEPLRQRISESQADGLLLLTLSATEGWIASGGMGGVAAERTTTTRVEVLLTPAGSDRRLWSATCKYGSKSRATQAILDTCAQKLVEQLFTDGVLAPSGTP